MTVRLGREFFKLTGSGNDFLFFDTREDPPGQLLDPSRIRELCARGTGVGADGIVFVERSAHADFAIRYFNADGSLASLCGNASLCATNLAVELGIADAGGLQFETDAGLVTGRVRDGTPEIDLQPVTRVEPVVSVGYAEGEQRIGYAEAGVPHVVVLCDDVGDVPIETRGYRLRWYEGFPQGANANFVSGGDGSGWRLRTFERGVEGETLACGTGAVATGVLLRAWGLTGDTVRIATRSGKVLTVRLSGDRTRQEVSLAGEGRVVYFGRLADVGSTSGGSVDPGQVPVTPR
jgi:diaminopimelate epimerase